MKPAVAIFVLALVLRLLYLGAALDRRWPHAAAYEGDAILWAAGAQTIASGAAPDDPLFFRGNAPAHLLRWLGFTDPARGYTAAKVLWCVVSALACAATYLFAARSFTPRVALIAAGLQVFSWDSYVLATSLNTEAPYALLVVLVLAGTWWLQRRQGLAVAVGLGVAHGLAILVRIEHLLLLPLLMGADLIRGRGPSIDGGDRAAKGGEGEGNQRPRPTRWRPLALQLAVAGVALVVCVPASVEQTRAARLYNTVQRRPTPYDRVEVSWTDDARAFLDQVPAFARVRVFAYVSRLAEQHGLTEVTAVSARQLWHDEFGDLPEPLRTPVFVSGQGPLNFALANHPAAQGGFSKAALENRFVSIDPRLTLSLPPHLRLYNHGYAEGLGFIRADPRGWLRAVGRKLWFFAQGASLALTAYNLPLGRYGERRPCDLLTPFPGPGWAWEIACAGLILAGAVIARRSDAGRLCLLVLVYKLVVTVGFFGYARQAASIGPVLALLVALALDALAGKLGTAIGRRGGAAGSLTGALPGGHRRAWLLVGSVVALGVALDVQAARHPPAFDIHGPLRATPEWGESSFSSNAKIELRPQTQ